MKAGAQLRATRKEVQRLERELERATAREQELQALMAASATDHARLTALSAEFQGITAEREQLGTTRLAGGGGGTRRLTACCPAMYNRAYMSLRFALLASLSARARTGYDLLQIFDSSIGFVWHAAHTQIYPELRRMEAEGLLESVEVPCGPRAPQARVPDDRIVASRPCASWPVRRWSRLRRKTRTG